MTRTKRRPCPVLKCGRSMVSLQVTGGRVGYACLPCQRVELDWRRLRELHAVSVARDRERLARIRQGRIQRQTPASSSGVVEKAFYEALPAEVKATLRAMEDP